MPDEILDQNPSKVEDILDILNQDDSGTDKESEEEVEVEVEVKEEEEKEEVSSEQEEEEEEEEVKEDLDDIDSFHTVPKKAEINKAFPELFKKFPGLEKAIYREQEYAELFPSPDAAKEAKDDLSRFRNLESDLLNGDITKLFSSIKEASSESYAKISDNILETLYQVDQKSYNNLLERVIRTALFNAHSTGKKSGNDQLEIAAEILNKWIFEDKEVKPYQKSSSQDITNKDSNELTELRKKQIEFAKQQLDSAVNDVSSRAQNIIKNTIDKNIDPKGIMTPYIRNKAIDDILIEVDKNFKSDKRFQEHLDRLWKSSSSDSYNESSKLKIRNAILAKAKSILPEIMIKVKTDALKGFNARVKKSESSETRTERKSLPKNEIPKNPTKGISTLDFLNQD